MSKHVSKIKRTMSKSKIGYTNENVPWIYAWNPGGFGCSMGCDGCWSKALAARTNHCPKCKAFEVHLHEERLCEPANTKKPGVVLVNFTCDGNDARRPWVHRTQIFDAMVAAPEHVYVLLTKNATQMARDANSGSQHARLAGYIYRGLTLRTPAEADAKLGTFLEIPGNLWLSLEPLQGGIEIGFSPVTYAYDDPVTGRTHRYTKATGCAGEYEDVDDWMRSMKGCIVGHDNRRGAPGTDTLDHIRSVVEQCRGAGVPVYVKQLWMWYCSTCELVYERRGGIYCEYGQPHRPLRPKLLRASHPDEYKLFPSDLKHTELPWKFPEATS